MLLKKHTFTPSQKKGQEDGVLLLQIKKVISQYEFECPESVVVDPDSIECKIKDSTFVKKCIELDGVSISLHSNDPSTSIFSRVLDELIDKGVLKNKP